MTQARVTYIRQRFDDHAPHYGHNFLTRGIGRSEMATLRTMIPPASQEGQITALDFGCGAGRSISLLLEAGYCVTGYDISEQMLARAQATLGQYPRVTLTSNPASVDRPWPLILSLGILDYYPDTVPLWQTWHRLLAQDGSLIVTLPNAKNPLAQLYTLSSRFTVKSYASTPEAMARAARTAGFSIVDVRYAFPNRWWGHTILLKLQHTVNKEHSP